MPTQAEELAALLDGEIDAADVSPEVAELAGLAEAVADHIVLVPPTPSFRAGLREELLEAVGGQTAAGAAATSTGAAGAAGAGGGGLSAVVAGLAATAVLATGTSAVLDQSVPGDPLYGAKRGVESVQLALSGDARDATLLAEFAAERVREAIGLVDVATVQDLLAEAQRLLDDALALGVEQGRDLDPLLAPSVAALRTLLSRTEDPAVRAQVVGLLADLGAEPRLGTDTDVGDRGDGAAPDGRDATVTDPTDDPTGEATDDTSGAGDAGDDVTDGVDDAVDDVTDAVDDAVDDVTDGVDDAVDDVTDGVDDAVDDAVDDVVDDVTDGVEDTVDDATELLEP